MTSDDYYKINANYGSSVKTQPTDSYQLLMINVNTNNTLNIEISYDYETTELQTKYREEIEYRTETKFEDVTKYRTEVRYREETKHRTETEYRLETQYQTVRETVTLWTYMFSKLEVDVSVLIIHSLRAHVDGEKFYIDRMGN